MSAVYDCGSSLRLWLRFILKPQIGVCIEDTAPKLSFWQASQSPHPKIVLFHIKIVIFRTNTFLFFFFLVKKYHSGYRYKIFQCVLVGVFWILNRFCFLFLYVLYELQLKNLELSFIKCINIIRCFYRKSNTHVFCSEVSAIDTPLRTKFGKMR